MSTNQERRAEARQRLRDQMEAQARKEKQLKIGAAAVVVVVLAGIVAVVVWRNVEQAQAEEYAANWASCEYPQSPPMEEIDPANAEAQGATPAQLESIEQFNTAWEEAGEPEHFAQPPTEDMPRKGTAEVMVSLNDQEVPATLDYEGTPCNTGSLVHLAQQQFFDDTECHRLTEFSDEMPLGVLQCGDPTGTGIAGPGYTIVDEPPTDLEPAPAPEGAPPAGSGAVVYPRGTIAMAKSSSPDSAGSQFFLVYEDSQLPPQYAVVGNISEEGLGVVDEIADKGTKSDDQTDPGFQVPAEEVSLDSVEVLSQSGLPEK